MRKEKVFEQVQLDFGETQGEQKREYLDEDHLALWRVGDGPEYVVQIDKVAPAERHPDDKCDRELLYVSLYSVRNGRYIASHVMDVYKSRKGFGSFMRKKVLGAFNPEYIDDVDSLDSIDWSSYIGKRAICKAIEHMPGHSLADFRPLNIAK